MWQTCKNIAYKFCTCIKKQTTIFFLYVGFGNEIDDLGNDNKYTKTELWLKHNI